MKYKRTRPSRGIRSVRTAHSLDADSAHAENRGRRLRRVSSHNDQHAATEQSAAQGTPTAAIKSGQQARQLTLAALASHHN